jgi:hypothetical protein
MDVWSAAESERRVRILHVYRTYFPDPPGGLQEAIRQMALTTAEHGVRPHVFALAPDPRPVELTRPEAAVTRGRSWAAPASCDLGGMGAFRLFSRAAREADVIHYHFPWPFADLLHLAVRPTAPAVMTWHSDIVRQHWLGRIYAPLMRRMIRAMSAVVATSPGYALTSPVLSNGALQRRLRIIPLGIAERSYPRSGDDAVLSRLGLD